MNARQKAKKYKRLYEALASSLFKPTVTYSNKDIIPLINRQVIKLTDPNPLPKDFVEYSVKKQLADEIMNYMNIEYKPFGEFCYVESKIDIVG